MKITLFLTGLLILTSCGPTKELVETPPPAPEEVVVEVEAPKPAEPRFLMSNIMSLERTTVKNIMGEPSLKRVEKEAEVWLYDNQFCNAHVYFYEDDNSDLRVEYVETNEEKNLENLNGQRADFCISTFLQD
ncbi:MAG: hypothetical protein HOH19_13355 [Kordiimonadaceae bacterium]|jgi:hypothetical protein|nr:hypothetical protein [Kordiimonadaceae bacterium]MBT6033558.1 hypothetical protein [Kordiimonadaceae bacterium]